MSVRGSGTEAIYSFLKRLQANESKKKIQMEDRKKIEETILENAMDGKISCATCFRIADDFGIPKKNLTKILNEMKIKITQCQLGCFE